MNDITFTKEGEQYVSNPIFGKGNGNVKYQFGYKKAGARLLLEQSYSPTEGYQLFMDKVAPQMPYLVVGTQFLPDGMYLRFRTDTEPEMASVDYAESEEGGGKRDTIIVSELPPVTEAKENLIYAVKNNSSSETNSYDEYIIVDGKWELLGTFDDVVTKEEVDDMFNKNPENPEISERLKDKIEKVIVGELPSKYDAKENVIYMVPNADGEKGNERDEYILVNGEWEKLGSSVKSVDDDDISALFKQ